MKLEIIDGQKERKAIKENANCSPDNTSSQYSLASSKNLMTDQSRVNVWALLILGTQFAPSVTSHCDLNVRTIGTESKLIFNQNFIE